MLAAITTAGGTAIVTGGDINVTSISHILEVPPGWTVSGLARSDATLTLRLALKPARPAEELATMAAELSDPSHPNFGAYLGLDDLAELVRSDARCIAAVEGYFRSASSAGGGGVTTALSPTRDWLLAEMPVRTASQLLGTPIYAVTNARLGGDQVFLRADPGQLMRAVPQAVARCLDLVGGLSHFPVRGLVAPAIFDTNAEKRQRAGGTHPHDAADWEDTAADPFASCSAMGCDGLVTPEVLRVRYNLSASRPATGKATQAVAQFLEQYYTPADLTGFIKGCKVATTQTQPAVIGPNNSSDPGIEATLDIEYVMGVAPGVPTTFLSTGGREATQEPFLEFLTNLGAMPTPPDVVSISYADLESSLEPAYAFRVDAEFQKLATRGVTILAASGDDGVGGSCGPTGCKFEPEFPASSPWVTAVGGTKFSDDWGPKCPNGACEISSSISGGGFSTLFAPAAWQRPAIAAFLKSGSAAAPPPGAYNKSGAGYPDVAAHCGDNTPYAVNINGGCTFAAGTSASCPTFAAVISMVNDARLSRGKPALGALNPRLYSGGGEAALFDIIAGDTNACDKCGVSGGGFKPTPGWDPVTGWGTPDFSRMVQKWID